MKNREATLPTAAGLCLLLGLAGCWGGGDSTVASSGDPEADHRADMRVGSTGAAQPKATLYERLGGAAGINALVDDMTARALADPRVNFSRTNVRTNIVGSKYKPWDQGTENVERFKSHMVEFLSLATGGPTAYSGREIRTVHKGMKITNDEFDAMVGDIKTSMDTRGIAAREKRDLLAIIETTRKQVVEKQ